MGTATLVRQLDGFTGDARLYRCEPPMPYRASWDAEEDSLTEFVVVSATCVLGDPETYVFPADAEGEIVWWGEIGGSFRGGLDHSRALAESGYAITATET